MKDLLPPDGRIVYGKPGKPSSSQLDIYQQLLNSSLDVLCSIDAEGHFVLVNTAATDVWGYSAGELTGRHYLDLVMEEDRSHTEQAMAMIMSGASITSFENRNRCLDGSIKPMVWSARWDSGQSMMYCVARDATDSKLTAQKLKHQERRLHRACELAGLAWWEYDIATKTYTSSDEIFTIYGREIPKDNKTTFEEFISYVHPDDRAMLCRDLSDISQNTYANYQHRVVKPCGEVIYVMHYSEVLRDEFNKPVAVHGTTKDVTEQKLQQLKMEESERTLERYAQKLTDTLESIGDGFFTLTRDWVVSYWNHKAEELMGKQRHELVGRNIWDVFPEVKHLKFYSESHLSLKRNIAIRFEEQYPHTKTWFEVDIYPNKDGLSVYFKDITSRKNGEEHLRIVNERLEFVSKATTDAIWDWDLVNNTNYFNASFKQLFGHSHHTTSIEESWSAHIHPEDKDKVSDSLSRSISNSAISNWSLEYRFMRADGTIANVFDRGFIIRDEKGQAIRMVGAMQDLTRQKEAESLMRLSEKKYKLLFYQSYIPMWTFDALTYQITDANEAALNLYGYTRKEFLSMSVIDLRAPEEKAGFLEMMKRIQEKKQRGYRDIFLHVKKNGEQFYIEVTSHGIDLPSGLHFLVAGLDMTEKLAKEKQRIEEKVTHQKEVAKAIIQTQEKERSEIGKELHDNVNQILTTVKLYIENIRSFPEHKDCFIDKSIELSQRAINEIRFLSKQLVTPVMADLGFHATIVEMVAHYTTMNVFEIDLNLESESLEMDKDMQLTIYRIIQEQLNNIIKYAQATRVQISIQDMKDAIQVKVEDNGCGFDPQKASGGLGLKNIRNRAEVFKGQVNIQSAPGEGCSLQISFPGTDQGAMRNRES